MEKVTIWIIMNIIFAILSKAILSLASVAVANLNGDYLLMYIEKEMYNDDYLIYYMSNSLYVDFTLIALLLNLYKWISKVMDIE
jgi:hypothetical protein